MSRRNLTPAATAPHAATVLVVNEALNCAERYGFPSVAAAEAYARLEATRALVRGLSGAPRGTREPWPRGRRPRVPRGRAMTRVDRTPLPPVAEGAAEGLATLAQVERAHIARVLEHAAYNYRAAAKILGISRSTLYVKVAAMRAERAAEQQPAEGGAA